MTTTILDPHSVSDSVLFRAATYDTDGVTLITPVSCVCSVWTAAGAAVVSAQSGTTGVGYAQYNWAGTATAGRYEATLTITLASGFINSQTYSVEIIAKPTASTGARSGMADLIAVLRQWCDCNLDDYEIAGVPYWSNAHLQTVLDRHRTYVTREPLESVINYLAGGSVAHTEYRSHSGNYEQTTGGTAIFIVEDGAGNDAGTALWSADYTAGIVTFAADTGGSAYYLTGRSYNLNTAAADVWRTKAAHAAKLYAFSTDNHSLSRNQIFEHCVRMADYYSQQAGASVVFVGRGDTL